MSARTHFFQNWNHFLGAGGGSAGADTTDAATGGGRGVGLGPSMMTGMPLLMSFTRRTTSQLAVLMQPWLELRPIVCPWAVPWMPMPGLLRPTHMTPTGLFGPIGSS